MPVPYRHAHTNTCMPATTHRGILTHIIQGTSVFVTHLCPSHRPVCHSVLELLFPASFMCLFYTPGLAGTSSVLQDFAVSPSGCHCSLGHGMHCSASCHGLTCCSLGKVSPQVSALSPQEAVLGSSLYPENKKGPLPFALQFALESLSNATHAPGITKIVFSHLYLAPFWLLSGEIFKSWLPLWSLRPCSTFLHPAHDTW